MGIKIEEITPVRGVHIKEATSGDLINIPRKFWQTLLYRHNVIVIDPVSLNKEQYIHLCCKFGCPWKESLYDLHQEDIGHDGIIKWSDQGELGKRSLPWHVDNSWHPRWRHPIRVLYAISIPDSQSGVLHHLDLTTLYGRLPDSEKKWLSGFKVLIQNFKNQQIRHWYPLVQRNPVTGKKGLNITAMDLDVNIFGLKKEPDYVSGNTFLLEVCSDQGEKLPLEYLAEYIQKSMELRHCHFFRPWSPGMIQVISNLDGVHTRTRISDGLGERLHWRKTMAHDFQAQQDFNGTYTEKINEAEDVR